MHLPFPPRPPGPPACPYSPAPLTSRTPHRLAHTPSSSTALNSPTPLSPLARRKRRSSRPSPASKPTASSSRVAPDLWAPTCAPTWWSVATMCVGGWVGRGEKESGWRSGGRAGRGKKTGGRRRRRRARALPQTLNSPPTPFSSRAPPPGHLPRQLFHGVQGEYRPPDGQGEREGKKREAGGHVARSPFSLSLSLSRHRSERGDPPPLLSLSLSPLSRRASLLSPLPSLPPPSSPTLRSSATTSSKRSCSKSTRSTTWPARPRPSTTSTTPSKRSRRRLWGR